MMCGTFMQGELDVILDLINLVEAQQYLEVSNIALETNAQQEQQQQALRLKQKRLQLKVRSYCVSHLHNSFARAVSVVPEP